MKHIEYYGGLRMGADPELFVVDKGKPIESKKLIKLGYDCGDNDYLSSKRFQLELNVDWETCRESLGKNFERLFMSLDELLGGKDVGVLFAPMVKIDNLDELSEDMFDFNYAESFNNYTKKKTLIDIDQNKYPIRTASGHIHFGYPSDSFYREIYKKVLRTDPELTVELLDILLGNTMVMIDRNPAQIERRKVYGKAGEYRLPSHGLEYRVLSNFWIRNYQLMGLVFGFARIAVHYAMSIRMDEEFCKFAKFHSDGRGKPVPVSPLRKIFELYNKADVERAINNNDFDLAKENWDKIKRFLYKVLPSNYDENLPITDMRSVREFDWFCKKGLDYWFGKADPLKYWVRTYVYNSSNGWENFRKTIVAQDMDGDTPDETFKM